MSIATFIESYEPTLGAHKRQILLVPFNNDVRVYTRVTDGTKGHHNAWRETDLATLKATINGREHITKEISGITVTSADHQSITSKGYSPVLGTKAMQAHDKATTATNITPTTDALDAAYNMVSNQASELENLIVDRRRMQVAPTPPLVPVQATPIDIQPEAAVVPAAAPAQEPELILHLATVPPKHLAERYVHRDIHGTGDFKVFDYARANHLNVLIYGPTGPGKTTAVEAWAAERGLRLAQISGNATLEPSQLFGKYIPDGNGGFMWVDGPVTDVVRNGGVLNLDELNFISPKVYTVLYTLLTSQRMITLLDHKGEVINAHDDFTVFATMNPDYIGTTPLNFAMRNRFDIQIPWDYDDKVEEKLVKSASLRTMVKQLRTEAAKGTFETPISTNMLIEFAEICRDLGYEFAAENFVAHFSNEEQSAVRMVVKTHEHNLKEDFGVAEAAVVDQGDEQQTVSLSDLLSQVATNNN